MRSDTHLHSIAGSVVSVMPGFPSKNGTSVTDTSTLSSKYSVRAPHRSLSTLNTEAAVVAL
eukprot:2734131-Amphidinium_carterae.1